MSGRQGEASESRRRRRDGEDADAKELCVENCFRMLYDKNRGKKCSCPLCAEGEEVMKNKGIKAFVDFIGKDIGGEYEFQKTTAIIRIILISLMVYFTANMIVCGITLTTPYILLFYSVFLLSFAGIFFLSYHCTTHVVLWCFNVSTMIWMVAILQFFGWNIGVQHLLMPLVLLYFFAIKKHYMRKIVYAVFITACRILLFFIFNKKTPVWQLSGGEENILQILNTITIFWFISVIAYVCSKNNQEMEERLIEYNHQLQNQVNTDALTGLFSRRKALEYMDCIIAESGWNNCLSLCICDIDHFKNVNDTYGHDTGDEILKAVAKVLKAEVSGNNLAARWGGEEFLLLFPGRDGSEVYDRLEQLRKRIWEMRVTIGDAVVGVTMTFGLAEYDAQNGLNATIKEADRKLYQGKKCGRNKVVF